MPANVDHVIRAAENKEIAILILSCVVESGVEQSVGLSPNNKISGQRVLSSRTRKVVNRAATILRLAAMIVGKTNTPLGSFYRRKRAQLGGPKAVTATARKLGCLIYRLIKNGQGYNEPDMHTYELKYKDQILNSLRKRANTFGFDLVELPKAA